MDRNDNTTGSVLRKWTGTALFLLAIAAAAAGVFLYHQIVVPRGYTWLFPWMEAAMLILLIFAGLWIALLWIPLTCRRKWGIWARSLVIYCLLVAVSAYLLPEKVHFKASPERGYMLVIREDSVRRTYSVERIYHRILLKQMEELPFAYPSEIKYQWLEEDVCAVTGTGTDGGTRQYLATFGDRGNGISYLDPLAAMRGHWSGVDSRSGDVEVTVDSVVTVRTESGSWSFEAADCQRFGTIGVTLGKGSSAAFSLSMNLDCRMNDNEIAKGGTLTLCPVSMEEMKPVILTSTDEREEYAEPEWMQAESEAADEPDLPMTDEEIVGLMRSLAKEYPDGAEGYEPTENPIFFLPLRDADMNWNVRNAVKAYMLPQDSWDIESTIQIESIRCLAGDETDGFYEAVISGLYVTPGYNGTADGEEGRRRLTLRMVRSEGGYYVYEANAGQDVAWDLEEHDEKPADVSKNSEYHFFIPGIYDPTDRYVYAKFPSEGMEEIYGKELKDLYPGAETTVYDGAPAMELDKRENIFLLYDGISKDLAHYCYRKVKSGQSGLTFDARLETLEEYEVVMKRDADYLPDFTVYSGTWTLDGKPADEVKEKGGAVLECTIKDRRWFEGSLLVRSASGQEARIEGIQSGIADTRIFDFVFEDDGRGNSGTLHFSFEKGKIRVKVLNFQGNTDFTFGVSVNGEYEFMPEEREERYHNDFMDTYDGSFEKEVQVPGTEIRYRMIVLDAALGSRFYGLIKSTDDGATWDIVSNDPFASQTGMGIDFTFLDENFGFATLAHNGGDSAVLYVTEDGGKSYEQVEIQHWTVTSSGGEIYAPYDFPQMPYFEDEVLYLKCGQGADGDYNGGDNAQLAGYFSDDHGHTFRFDRMVEGK